MQLRPYRTRYATQAKLRESGIRSTVRAVFPMMLMAKAPKAPTFELKLPPAAVPRKKNPFDTVVNPRASD